MDTMDRNQYDEGVIINPEDSEAELVSDGSFDIIAPSVSIPSSISNDSDYKTIQTLLENNNWNGASQYCDGLLKDEKKKGIAYLGKLLVELELSGFTDLITCDMPFENRLNYIKAKEFGSEDITEALQLCVDKREEFEEEKKKYTKYFSLVKQLKTAQSEFDYRSVAEELQSISGYKDVDELIQDCLTKADQLLEERYCSTVSRAETANSKREYADLVVAFEQLGDYKDSVALKNRYQARLDQLVDAEKKKGKKVGAIILSSVAVIVLLAVLITQVISPAIQHRHAMDLIESGEYDEAYAILEELGDQETITNSLNERGYALLEEGRFNDAYRLFKEAGNEEAIKADKRERGLKLLDEGKYDDAYVLLEQAGESSVVKNSKVERGKKLLQQEQYDEAYALLREAGDEKTVKDSVIARATDLIDSGEPKEANELLAKYDIIDIKILKTIISSLDVKETVLFGEFQQEAENSNPKDIEWIILEKRDGEALLISKYALYAMKFSNVDYDEWDKSAVRNWMNGDFLISAFNDEERKIIKEVTNSFKMDAADEEWIKTSTDKIFLLDVSEVKTYFPDETERIIEPTGYARPLYDLFCSDRAVWWLRDEGYAFRVSVVKSDGSIDESGVNKMNAFYVRPAFWISLDN